MPRETKFEYDIAGLATMVEQIEEYSAAEAAREAHAAALWEECDRLMKEKDAVMAEVRAKCPEQFARMEVISKSRARVEQEAKLTQHELVNEWHERCLKMRKDLFAKYPERVRAEVYKLVEARRRLKQAEANAAKIVVEVSPT